MYGTANKSSWGDSHSVVKAGVNAAFSISSLPNGVTISFTADSSPRDVAAPLITREFIGVGALTKQGIENHDGSPITISKDLLGAARDMTHPSAGPIEQLKAGVNTFTINAGAGTQTPSTPGGSAGAGGGVGAGGGFASGGASGAIPGGAGGATDSAGSGNSGQGQPQAGNGTSANAGDEGGGCSIRPIRAQRSSTAGLPGARYRWRHLLSPVPLWALGISNRGAMRSRNERTTRLRHSPFSRRPWLC